MSNVVLDKEPFFRRIKRLYSEWKVRQPSISGLNACLFLVAAKVIGFHLLCNNLRSTRLNRNSLQSPEFSHDDSLTKIDCLMCAVGADEDILYSKSTALQVRQRFLRHI